MSVSSYLVKVCFLVLGGDVISGAVEYMTPGEDVIVGGFVVGSGGSVGMAGMVVGGAVVFG